MKLIDDKMRKRLLIVEDNEDFAENLVELLEQFGCDAEVAPSAEEALERLRRNGFSGVLTDVRLPGKSGVDLAEHVRAQAEPPVKIAVMSAYLDEQAKTRAYAAGAVKVMPKPVDLDDLAEVIAAFAA